MSLINDALKRAKQAQPDAPRPTISGLSLHPVESSRRPGFMIPVITLAAVALVLVLGWRVFLKGSGAQSPSHSSPSPATDSAGRQAEQLIAKAAPAAVSEAHPQPASASSTGAEPPAAAPVDSVPASAPGTPTSTTAVQSAPNSVAVDASIASEAPPAPKPAPLKLQGILFDPAHPAAMISGRTLFVGDKLGEWRVVAISQESATLVNAGQTNLLALPQ